VSKARGMVLAPIIQKPQLEPPQVEIQSVQSGSCSAPMTSVPPWGTSLAGGVVVSELPVASVATVPPAVSGGDDSTLALLTVELSVDDDLPPSLPPHAAAMSERPTTSAANVELRLVVLTSLSS